MKVMLNKINFKMLAGAICAFIVGILTMAGITQNYIPFAGIDNEMGFSLLSFMMGSCMLMCIKK